MCIQMLQILNSGKPYKISELAALLDTNERNIIEYRKELEEAGFYINSVPGRYGGYTIDSKNILPSIQLLPEEKDSILGAYSYIVNRTTFPKRKEFIQGMAKIFSRIDLTNQQYNEVTQLDGFSMFMSTEAINKIYVEFEQAIKEQKKFILIIYRVIMKCAGVIFFLIKFLCIIIGGLFMVFVKEFMITASLIFVELLK